MQRAGWFIGFAGLFLWVMADPPQKLLVLYNERPPYMASDGRGGVVGLTADVADYALRKSGIPYEWLAFPSMRQMQIVSENKEYVAALGWFKNPERERMGKFSAPLYQDRKIAVLVRKEETRVGNVVYLDSLLRDSSLSLLVKLGYSYGSLIDQKIAKQKPWMQKMTLENQAMVHFIGLGRADYMFIAPEEADVLFGKEWERGKAYRLVELADVPVGELRYLLFSRLVDDSIIARLDKYIRMYTRMAK